MSPPQSDIERARSGNYFFLRFLGVGSSSSSSKSTVSISSMDAEDPEVMTSSLSDMMSSSESSNMATSSEALSTSSMSAADSTSASSSSTSTAALLGAALALPASAAAFFPVNTIKPTGMRATKAAHTSVTPATAMV